MASVQLKTKKKICVLKILIYAVINKRYFNLYNILIEFIESNATATMMPRMLHGKQTTAECAVCAMETANAHQ